MLTNGINSQTKLMRYHDQYFLLHGITPCMSQMQVNINLPITAMRGAMKVAKEMMSNRIAKRMNGTASAVSTVCFLFGFLGGCSGSASCGGGRTGSSMSVSGGIRYEKTITPHFAAQPRVYAHVPHAGGKNLCTGLPATRAHGGV